MKRTPIRRVSTKRAKQLREYAKLRSLFLQAHPYCQVWLDLHNLNEDEVEQRGVCVVARIPRSVDIHHISKRNGERLNDTGLWLAVSREMHERIHREPKWARERGYLL